MSGRPKKLAILAGGGVLPRQVADACIREGIPYLTVDLGGAAATWIRDYDGLSVSLGQVGRLMDALKEQGCDAVTMAGPIARPQLSDVRFDWRGTKLLPRVAKLFRQGDDALLRGIAEIFEENGFRVVGPEIVLHDVIAGAGVLTAVSPRQHALQDISMARDILSALSPHDVGQAVVVAKGVCIAVEAAEGTAEMLKRVAGLRAADAPAGVLVKLPKIGQDKRLDLPTIGPETAAAAAAAKLSGIAVEAGSGFILEREETVRRCDVAGLFLIGLTSPDK